ncbi:uncharacterized protein LOC134219376 [Armigeres subalbatus]|uniref:uncharacterized protein LOC134219376 n=1 Tax=Armigeres subalbatus TaxID=124917 RepID=UPI002ED134FD
MEIETKEELVEIIVAQDELSDDADPDVPENEALRYLVTESWGLDATVYEILIAHGYTMDYLKILDEKALNDVFSITKWTAHKHALRRRLISWDESVLYQEAGSETVAKTSTITTDQSPPSEPKDRKLLPTNVTTALLDNILQRNEKGKIVSKYYQLQHRLDKQHRKYLAHTIVDYYIANQKYFSLPDMERFAELIVDRFPPEIAMTYYNPRNICANKRHPSGMLYDRFHNRKKSCITSISNVPKVEPSFHSEQKLAALELSATEIRRLESSKTWLRNNCAPGHLVLSQWKQSILLRLRSIHLDKDINKSTVMSEWPRYLDEDGYLLVDVDFDYLFQRTGKSNKLLEEWESFCSIFLEYLSSGDVRDDNSRQLLCRLEEDDHPEDTRDFVLCVAFHGLVKPVRASSKKLSTILQAQIDTCNICETQEELIESLNSQRSELESKGVQFSPRIYAVGQIDNFEGFFVVTNKLVYKLPSLIRCLDVVVKLKFALDLQFPESSELFWVFVSKYFYDIDYTQKSKNTQILQLLAFLESHKK